MMHKDRLAITHTYVYVPFHLFWKQPIKGTTCISFFEYTSRNIHAILNRPNLTNSTMHRSHIPQCTSQNRNVHISVLNGVLWDMGQVQCGICEIVLLSRVPAFKNTSGCRLPGECWHGTCWTNTVRACLVSCSGEHNRSRRFHKPTREQNLRPTKGGAGLRLWNSRTYMLLGFPSSSVRGNWELTSRMKSAGWQIQQIHL